MAYVVFESGYSDACGRDWYVEIVSLTAIGNTDKEMLLMAPGVSISYEMDSFNLAKAMIGSALEMTVQFTDNQMTKLNAILDHEEGQVGVILYRGNSAQLNNIEWCGHLLIEQVSIMMAKDMNTTTMTFTDGLGFLKYTDYRSVDGDMYFDRQPLIRQLFRCLHKLPTMNIIKSRYNGSYDFVIDVGLPEPVNPGSTFDYWQEASTEQGVLNNVYVHSQTFGKAKNQTERWRRLFQDSGFVSAYDVVEDIAKTLGCCIAFTNGRWYLWNRSSVTVFNENKSELKSFKHTVAFSGGLFIFSDGRPAIASSSNSGQTYQDIYVGEDEYSHVIKGATEGRTIPLAQVLMTHEDVEKDSIISEGTRRRRFGWMDSGGGGFSPHSQFNGYPGNVFAAPANDQYTYGANRNYGYEYVFDFTLYDEVGSEISPNNRYKNNIATVNPNFQFGFPKRVNSQLFIKGGEPMSFAVAGSINLRERKQNAATLLQIYTHPMGSTYVLKARIEVEDSDGNAYRLSRTVRVLQPNEKAGTDTKFLKPPGAGTGTQETSANHYHKVYNDMEWVASNESGYSDSWFELMIPHGSSADNTDADFTNEVAVINEQFEGQNSYGGILCDFDEDDNRLEGGSDTTKGNYLKLFFKENIQFEFPENDTVNFVKVKLEWRMSFIDHRGRLWWESGAGTSPTASDWDDPTFPSETNTPNNDVYGWFFYPRNIKLQYAEIKVGQDGKDMDLQTVAQGGPGFETYNMGASRIGSRDELINRQVTGHLIAPYIDNGAVNNQSDDPALAGVGYVNVKWTTSNDEQGADSGRYNSLHQLLVTEYMANFGQQLSTYQGSIKESPTREANNSPEEILRPFCVFTTKQFRDSVSIDVMITRLKWSMLDGYQFEGVGIGADRYANSSISIQELKPVGRGGGRSGRKPDFGSGIYNINGIQRLRTINKNFTIDSTTGEITVIAVKNGSTVFSADNVGQGATNKFGTSAQFTKLDGVEAGATANQSDAHLKNRGNHTGTQLSTTISDFAAAVTDVQAVRDNSDKTSFPGFGTGAGQALEGTTTTIADIGSLPGPTRSDGTGDSVDALIDHSDDLLLVATSEISGQTGSVKFSLQQLWQSIIQAGIGDMVDGGYVTEADYVGGTSGFLGDFDDNGSVGVGDVLALLSLYGTVYSGDNSAFQPAEVVFDRIGAAVNHLQFYNNPGIQYMTIDEANDVDDVTPAGVSINIYEDNETPANTVEFVSGSNAQYPITSWTQKRVKITPSGTSFFHGAFSTIGCDFIVSANIKGINSSGTVVVEDTEVVGSAINALASLNSYTFEEIVGSPVWTSGLSLSDSSIEKVQVRLGIEPRSSADALFSAMLVDYKIRLVSVS